MLNLDVFTDRAEYWRIWRHALGRALRLDQY